MEKNQYKHKLCIFTNTGIFSLTRIKHVSETDTLSVLFNGLSIEISMDRKECKESLIYIMSVNTISHFQFLVQLLDMAEKRLCL